MTLTKAKEIREKYNKDPVLENIRPLAEEYDVSDAIIYCIIKNYSWKE